MKKLKLSFAAMLFVCVANGQSTHFSQFYSTPMLINPAATGLTYGPYRVAANYRNQWNDAGSAYKTFTVSGDGHIMKSKLPEGNVLGLGLTLVNDKTLEGAVQGNSVALSTAYHVALDEVQSVGVGFQGTYNEKRVDFSRLHFENQYNGNDFDPSLPAGEALGDGKKYYFEGAPGDLFGQRLFETCLELNPEFTANYWYLSDAAFLNSYNTELSSPDIPYLEKAEKVWKDGFNKTDLGPDSSWAFLTRAYIEERKQFLAKQWNNELKYRALFYSASALCFDPEKPDRNILAARFSMDVGLRNHAFALSGQAYQNNPNDFDALEQMIISVLDSGDLKNGEEYLKILQNGKPHNSILYKSWQAFIHFHHGAFTEGIALLEECLQDETGKSDLWSHYNLLLFYWLTGNESKSKEMVSWIQAIEGKAYYPFTENEQSTALMVEGKYEDAASRITQVIQNATFEPYASSLLMSIALQQGNTSGYHAIKDAHLAMRLSHPEIQVTEWLTTKGFEIGKKLHPGKEKELHDWLYHEQTGLLTQLARQKEATSNVASDKLEVLLEEFNYQLDHNSQCAINTWGHVAVMFLRAVYYYKKSQWELSLSLLDSIFKSDELILSDHPEMKKVLDTCYTQIKTKHDIALESLRKDQVDLAIDENEKGNALNDEGKYAEALEHYKKAVELDPTPAVYYRNIGLMYNSLGQWELSFENYRKSLDIEPQNAYAQNYAGTALFRLEKFSEALPYYLEANKLEEGNKTYVENLALTYSKLGMQDEAITWYEKAVSISPDDDYLINELANFKFMRGDMQGARSLYEKAIVINPPYSIYHYNLGRTYYQEKDFENAKIHFHKAIELDPKNDFAYNFLGNSEMEHTQDYDKAISFYEKAKAVKPEEAFYSSNLGLALYYMGKLDEAEKHFEEALKINENLPDAYNGVGLLYYAREEYADAARQFNRASRLAPDNQTFSANVEAALSFLNEKVREEIMKEFA